MLKKLIIATGLLGIVGSALILAVPALRARVEHIPFKLESWWHEMQPRDQYVPPPAEVASDQPQTSQPEPANAQAPTRTPNISAAAAPSEFRLTNFKHDYQGWNNCGPTTLSMLLSHFGSADTQKEIAPVLKPNPNDKNVGPDELAAYAQTKPGLNALYRVNGNVALLKQLLANGFAVVVEMWFVPRPNDGMGHYRLLIGYSDTQGKFFALDSYSGPSVTLPYADFDADWKVFNRLYLVAYRPEQSELLSAIVGDARGDQTLWTQARAQAQSEVAANNDDAFAWYNLGSALGALGQHAEAAKAFDRARRLGLPWRMLWYQFQIFDSYLAVGRNQDVLALVAANLRQAGDLEESHFYRGRALQAMGKTEEAIKAYREALRFNRNYQAAASALKALGAA